MKFKTEDDAYDAYLDYVQSESPFDITEWERDLSEGFYDWLIDNSVEFEDV